MPVRGLLSYVLRHQDYGATQRVDLVQEAARHEDGVTLLVDLADFVAWFLPEAARAAKSHEPDTTFAAYGGEFAHYDSVLSDFIFGLRSAGVYLEFFADAPRGSGLVDASCSGGTWADEAKRKVAAALDCAKSLRLWGRGERATLPQDFALQPVLWFDQFQATLERCGCPVRQLEPDEQAPLLYLGHGGALSHVFAVLSDNIDWAVVKGVRLIPLQCFDLDADARPSPGQGDGAAWRVISRLSACFTSCDLLAEKLRLGHPPRDEEIQEASAKGGGRGKGSFGVGNWPYKWWNEQVLVELALLCGTELTTTHLQKHKLYGRLDLNIGSDPVDSIVRWLRSQLYTRKLRWRDLKLESLSEVFSGLAQEDAEFSLALRAGRALYAQNVNALRKAQAELARLRKEGSENRSVAAYPPTNDQDTSALPWGSSLFLHAVVRANRVWLEVAMEDFSRSGSPLTHQLLADLRRLTYTLLQKSLVFESGIPADSRTAASWTKVELDTSIVPPLQQVQRWPYSQRWLIFRRFMEHQTLQNASGDAGGESGEVSATPVEKIVWDAVRLEYESGKLSTKMPASFRPQTVGFLGAALEYFVSLNARPAKTLIQEHEFDTVAATAALCYDVSLPGAPFADAPPYLLMRFGELKAYLTEQIASHFHVGADLRVPPRAGILGTWFQAVVRHLMDVARLLSLDSSSGADGLTPIFLPEPRELFCGSLLAALYLGGAYDAWEVESPRDSYHLWEPVLREFAAIRNEIVWSEAFQNWKHKLFGTFHAKSATWPSAAEIAQEYKINSQRQDELPIEEHRDKIIKHIEGHRVTCIQGETGCGKSTRVPVFIMEDYFERKKAKKIKDDEKFMVLCTQPRRIACISLANRVAACLKEKVGDTIGYKISGDSNVRPGRTKLVYVTTGYLLQVLVNNPEQIRNYTHLVLDEVHERDVDSDLLSLVIKLQMMDYDFKLVVMSATLQGDLFSRYFSDKKIKTIFVGVKRFPVEVIHVEQILDRYGNRGGYGGGGDFDSAGGGTQGLRGSFCGQATKALRDAERIFGTGGYDGYWEEEETKPHRSEFDDSSGSSSSGSSSESEDVAAPNASAVAKAEPQRGRKRKEVTPLILHGLDVLCYELILRVANPGEGILVFLPGIGEISDLQETLLALEDTARQAQMPFHPGISRPDVNFKVFVLHSLIPKDEQEGAVFDAPPPDTCHVILASNIAESSLTIPMVRVVIDYGLRRQLIYDKRRHMSCLVTAWVSQASAKQRCGRTGRVFEGVNIRLFTKDFHDKVMQEFDAPEMQTAPLEKLYVNVKHLSAKLPEYQVSETERRRRTPKELLSLVAQPPDMSSIEAAVQLLDQLGAITDESEDAEMTVLGHLMMSVPLDVQLCRLVLFGSILDMPCDGIVMASALSVQDPFTLPSHLIIKEPKEYAEALRRSYESRFYFDHGHHSEPLMYRALFVQWLSDFRKNAVARAASGGRRENQRGAFTRCSQGMAGRFAVVPKRLVHLATSVVDTATRMRKFLPAGSKSLQKVDALLKLLGAGDIWFASKEEAEEGLPKIEDLLSDDAWRLKTLLVAAFCPQFMIGTTKIRPDEPVAQPEWPQKKTKGKKPKPEKPKKKETNKMEQLVTEMMQAGLDPSRSVACQLELPRGRGAPGPWQPTFHDDLKLTFSMLTCSTNFDFKYYGDNKVMIQFERGEDKEKSLPSGAFTDKVAVLTEESGLIQDVPTGAHQVDLYGAGRWKFQVPLLSTLKLEKERQRKEALAEQRRKEAEERKAKAEAAAQERAEKERLRKEKQAKIREEREKAAKEKAEKAKREEERERRKKEGLIGFPEAPSSFWKQLYRKFGSEEEEEVKAESPAAQTESVSPAAEPEAELEDSSPAAIEVEADGGLAAEDGAVAKDAEEEEEQWEEELPLMGIYKPVSPYELNWELIDQGEQEQKGAKRKIMKGKCSWRNPVGFLCTTDTSESGGKVPKPNEVFAVFTTTQGGDSKEMSWVDGVTLLSSDGENVLAFVLLITFLRSHQDLRFDVDLQDGRIHAIHGPSGLDLRLTDEQLLLVEDLEKINAVRREISLALYVQAPYVKPTAMVPGEDGIDFSGSKEGKKDADAVPQLAAESKVAEALNDLLATLRTSAERHFNIDEASWSQRLVLRKPRREVVDMHRTAQHGRKKREANERFDFLEPLTDLVEAKKAAERQQAEEDEAERRRKEEEKRRKREEADRRALEKRRREEEAARQWEEQQRRNAARKAEKAGKGGRAQQVRQQQQWQDWDEWYEPPSRDQGRGLQLQQQQQRQQQLQLQQQQQQGKKGKGGKSAGKEDIKGSASIVPAPSASASSRQQRPQQTQQQNQQPRQQQQQRSSATPTTVYDGMPYPWAAVADANTGRYYYWNQQTNEVTWTPPMPAMPPMPAAPMDFSGMAGFCGGACGFPPSNYFYQ